MYICSVPDCGRQYITYSQLLNHSVTTCRSLQYKLSPFLVSWICLVWQDKTSEHLWCCPSCDRLFQNLTIDHEHLQYPLHLVPHPKYLAIPRYPRLLGTQYRQRDADFLHPLFTPTLHQFGDYKLKALSCKTFRFRSSDNTRVKAHKCEGWVEGELNNPPKRKDISLDPSTEQPNPQKPRYIAHNRNPLPRDLREISSTDKPNLTLSINVLQRLTSSNQKYYLCGFCREYGVTTNMKWKKQRNR